MLNILLAEDSRAGEILVELLHRTFQDIEVSWKLDGALALDDFIYDNFHVVITDLQMSELNGVQLAKKIKDINPNIPIFLWTGTVSSDIEHSLFEQVIMKDDLDAFSDEESIFRQCVENIRDNLGI